MNNNITPQELKDRLNKGEKPFILDVREDWEYEQGNINGKLIPLGELPNRLNEIEEYKNDEVIINCKSGGRSAQAQAYLQKQGFTNVRNLTGGYEQYKQLN
jgi:rhodanese-related sulfurtransferase